MLLQHKVALITGASRGIGQAIAEVFAQHGARLVLTARSESLDGLAGGLAESGTEVLAVRGDINDEIHVRELIKQTRARFGRLDVLVNNAGILQQGLLGMVPSNSARQLFDTNIIAMINMTQYAARAMSTQKSGSIINMASIAGTEGINGASAYSATKAAVVGFTLAAAKELASKQIRVNAIAPGFIDTDMTRGLAADFYARNLAGVRMGRIGSPRDVAHAALFLGSDLSTYVTGQVLGVDGGFQV
jgi:3-oxoacyl-[acyl-carrier protein] reductase